MSSQQQAGGRVLVTGGAGFIGTALAPSSLAVAERGSCSTTCTRRCTRAPSAPPTSPERGRPPRRRRDDPADDLGRGRWPTCDPTSSCTSPPRPAPAQSLAEAPGTRMVNVVGTTADARRLRPRHDALPAQIVLTSSPRGLRRGRLANARTARRSSPGSARTRSSRPASGTSATGPPTCPTREPATSRRPDQRLRRDQARAGARSSPRGAALARAPGSSVLRLQNVYGPGQSLINPYTGIVSLFCAAGPEAGRSIPLYEDGEIIRDFVFIDDVASALVAVVAHGRPTTCAPSTSAPACARRSSTSPARSPLPRRAGAPRHRQYRDGDVRHASCTVEDTVRQLGLGPS